MLARWGAFVARHRWWVLLASVLVFAASLGALLRGGELKDTRTTAVEAGRAFDLIDRQLPRSNGTSFDIVFGSTTLRASDAAFRDAVTSALDPLARDRRVSSVTTPYTNDGAQAAQLTSRDSHRVLAVIAVRDDFPVAQKYYPELRAKIHPGPLEEVATGNLAVQRDFDFYLQRDLQRAENFSLPLALVILLLVFGAAVAAGLPVGVGLLTIVGGLAGVFLLSHTTSVSQYALNIVTLIGLGVSIDYSLFIVSRFREELGRGSTVEAALSRSLATAGRATTFSGLTVAVGLSGMLFFNGTFLTSLGLAGTFSVAAALVYGLTFLPAVLAILGPRVNLLRLPLVGRAPIDGQGFWHRLASAVMRRPVLVLVPTVGMLLLAGLPFRDIRLANGDITELPLTAESRQGYEVLLRDFPGRDQTQILMVVDFASGNPLSADHVGVIYDLSRRLAAIPNVLRVESPVDTQRGLTREAYQALYANGIASLDPAAREQLRQAVGKNVVLLSVLTSKPAESDAARAIVHAARTMRHVGPDGTLLVTGQTAFDIDFIDFILQHTPLAVAFVMVVTYVILFLMLGSILLPLKAVLMNLLSLSASFGALVWIFQQGHLSNLLAFTPTSIDPSVPVILFCIVFGLSMDYEVLLMSRMKEEFERTGDNRQAVAEGLERSGRLVSGAAAIMVGVFVAFALADVVLIKSIGLGMAIAVAIDATLVRALIVPATMRLLGNLNWWAPAPVARLHRRLVSWEAKESGPGTATPPAPALSR